MKGLAALSLIALLAGACNSKKTTTDTASTPAPSTPAGTGDQFFTGAVSTIYVDDGCPFMVIVDKSGAPDAPGLLLPIALDPQYLKSGLRLRFTYRLSRASSGDCKLGVPAILENVTVIQ